MPRIRCPHCKLRQYVVAGPATQPPCAECGRVIPIRRAALIEPALVAWQELRTGSAGRAWRGRS